MKIKLNSAVSILSAVMALGFFAAAVRAQQSATGHANDFTSVVYYEAPHPQLMKSRMSGAEAQPDGQRLLITQLKLEMFDTNGAPEVVVKAPHCVYDTQTGVANSPGHIRLESGDGKSHVEGDGFLFRRDDSFLTISNHVHTVIENMPGKTIGS
jgi:hypothetical protein